MILLLQVVGDFQVKRWNHVCLQGMAPKMCWASASSSPTVDWLHPKWPRFPGFHRLWDPLTKAVSLGGWLPWRHRCWDRFPERVSFFNLPNIMVILLVPKVYGQTRGNLSLPNLWFGVIALPVSTFDFKCSLLTVFYWVGIMPEYDVYMAKP